MFLPIVPPHHGLWELPSQESTLNHTRPVTFSVKQSEVKQTQVYMFLDKPDQEQVEENILILPASSA